MKLLLSKTLSGLMPIILHGPAATVKGTETITQKGPINPDAPLVHSVLFFFHNYPHLFTY